MRTLKLALLATAATAAFSSATFAADLILDPPQAPIVMNSGNLFDGVYLGAFLSGQDVPGAFGVGGDIGFNATSDMLMFGGELQGSALSNGTFSAQAHGKLGVLVTDTAAVYGLAGIGAHSTNGAYVPVGVGAEIGVSDNLSLKGEYQFNWDLSSSAQNANVVRVGLNWHF